MGDHPRRGGVRPAHGAVAMTALRLAYEPGGRQQLLVRGGAATGPRRRRRLGRGARSRHHADRAGLALDLGGPGRTGQEPRDPGARVLRIVVALGPGTTGVAVGDPVFGLADWYRDGAAATHLAVEARNLAAKPLGVSYAEAACVPLAASTAWQALFVHGRLRAGQRVLVHGAAGGVGVFAVQLAGRPGRRYRHRPRTRGAARRTGASGGRPRPRDLRGRRPGGPRPRSRRGRLAQRSWPLVRAGGALVTVVGGVPRGRPRPDARWVFFVVEPDRRLLAELARSIDAGELRPVLGATFPLAGGRQAFEAKQAGGIPARSRCRWSTTTERAAQPRRSTCRSCPREAIPSLANTLRRWASTVRGLEVELPRDLLVGAAGDDQGGDLALLRGQRCGRRRVAARSRRWLAARRGRAPPRAGHRAGRSRRRRRAGGGVPRPGAAPAGGARPAGAVSGPGRTRGRTGTARRALLVVTRRESPRRAARGTGAAGPRPTATATSRPGLEGGERGQRAVRPAGPDGRLDQVGALLSLTPG